MAGFIPAIHVFHGIKQDVDARDKPGHDGIEILNLKINDQFL